MEAAKAQLSSALLGLLGALVALMLGSSSRLENTLVLVLPFTAGGFLNIAFSLVPDLMQEKQASSACCQLLCVIAGVMVMSFITFIH